MVDTGASSNFVSRRMVDHLKLEYVRCPPGEEVLFRLANNTVYVSSLTAIVPIRIANTMHEELLNMRVIETASFAMIFGMPWLRRHCPRLHFDTLQVELSCLNNGRCFPVRFDDETEYYDASSTLGSSITSSSPVIISSNATIVDLPVQATMEPRADPFAGYPEHHPEELIELPPINVIHTEQPTVLPPIQLPPVDFNHALQQLQEQFVHEMHNQQAQLDEWIENNTWEQQDKWLQNANNDNWIAHKNHNWLQVIQPMLTQEDERSIYELQHSEEMINQQVIATIINLDTPPQSDHEEDNDGFEFIQEVINVDTPSATPPPPHECHLGTVVCKAYVHQHVPEDYMHIWLHTHKHVDTQRVPGQAIVTFDLATRHVVCLLVDHRLCTGNTQLNMRQTLYCQDPLNAYTSRSSLYVCTLHQIFHTRTY